MNRNSQLSAFTLVELLVVIGIIAVIIAILLPTLSKARKQAQLVQCESNLRQWGIGVANYVDQYQGALPQKGPGGNTHSQAFGPLSNGNGVVGYDDSSLWFNALPPYLGQPSYFSQLVLDSQNPALNPAPQYGNNNLFICPTAFPPGTFNGNDIIDTNPNYFDLLGIDSTNTIRVGLHPQQFFKYDICYAWNSKMLSPIHPITGSFANSLSLKMVKLKPSSRVPLLVEKISSYTEYMTAAVQNWCNANPSVYSNVGGAQHQGWITPAGLTGTNVQQAKSDWTRFAVCHNDGGNILFADGHVELVKWVDVQYGPSQLPWRNSSDANVNNAGIIWCPVGPTD